MLTWRHHQNGRHNVFIGDPETSQLCAVIYPYDGGYLWEVRHRCDCCAGPVLIQTGSARNVDDCFARVGGYMKMKAAEGVSD